MSTPHSLLKKINTVLRREGVKSLITRVINKGYVKIYNNRYHKWFISQQLTQQQLDSQREAARKLHFQPRISVLVPTYNTDSKVLAECLNSVREQTYENWELCVADGASTNADTIQVLKDFANASDKRIKIKFLDANYGISGNSNGCLNMATGQYVALLDHDDVLTPDALYEIVAALNIQEYDLVYTDEDKLTPSGKYIGPCFKPGWSPEAMYTSNYVCHFTVLKTQLLIAVGGFDSKADGAQDWDIVLKVSELTSNVGHIPKVLYHWRISDVSTAKDINVKPYALGAQVYVVQGFFDRNNIAAKVYRNDYNMLSITWPSNEKKIAVIVIKQDNDTDYQKAYANPAIHSIHCVNKSDPNLVQQINKIITEKAADYYVFINDAVEPIGTDWALSLTGLLSIKNLAAIGAKILNRSNRIIDFGKITNDEGSYRIYYNAPQYTSNQFGSAWHTRNLIFISDQFFAIAKTTFDKVGLFNECDQLAEVFNNYFLKIFQNNLRLVTYPAITAKTKTHYRPSSLLYTKTAPFIDPYTNPHLFTAPRLFREVINYKFLIS